VGLAARGGAVGFAMTDRSEETIFTGTLSTAYVGFPSGVLACLSGLARFGLARFLVPGPYEVIQCTISLLE
jgi:hypothetical protein